MRSLIMEDTEFLGVDFDFEENRVRADGIHVLSKPSSRVKVFVLPTNEELSIARETLELVSRAKK